MKKIYSLSVLFLGMATAAFAQCTITSATVTPNGLSVNAVMIASGAAMPGYGWDWGDATSPATTQSASHTYASPGVYTVCAVYVDITNTSCIDTLCQSVTVTAVDVAEANAGMNTISAAPNPFGTTATFNVNLVQNADVEITIYDITGKKIETIQDGEMNAGKTQIVWTPENLAEGVYFAQMVIDGVVTTRRIVHTSGN